MEMNTTQLRIKLIDYLLQMSIEELKAIQPVIEQMKTTTRKKQPQSAN